MAPVTSRGASWRTPATAVNKLTLYSVYMHIYIYIERERERERDNYYYYYYITIMITIITILIKMISIDFEDTSDGRRPALGLAGPFLTTSG